MNRRLFLGALGAAAAAQALPALPSVPLSAYQPALGFDAGPVRDIVGVRLVADDGRVMAEFAFERPLNTTEVEVYVGAYFMRVNPC
jgi:hypothetical protein